MYVVVISRGATESHVARTEFAPSEGNLVVGKLYANTVFDSSFVFEFVKHELYNLRNLAIWVVQEDKVSVVSKSLERIAL